MQPSAQAPVSTRRQRFLAWLCWLYLAGLLILWWLLAWESDDWWPVTFVAFGPRWVWGLPLAVLVPTAALFHRRQLWVLLIALLIWIIPVMGLCVPWRSWLPAPTAQVQVRVLTFNVDKRDLDARALARFITATGPDVVALQDWDEVHVKLICQEPGWHTRAEGQFFLASRFPIREAELATRPPFDDRFCRYRLEVPGGSLHFFNIRLKTPRDGLVSVLRRGSDGAAELQRNSKLRRRQSEAASHWIGESTGAVLIAGDFNMPPDSTIFRDSWSPFQDAYATAAFGWGYTYYNNRTALRLDHVLAGPGWRCRACRIGPAMGSEHLPLVADMEYAGPME